MSFGRRIALAFAAMTAFSLVGGLMAVYALHSVIAAKDRVITKYVMNLRDAALLSASFEGRVAVVRGYLLARNDEFVQDRKEAQQEFETRFRNLVSRADGPEEKALLAHIERASAAQKQAGDEAIAERDRPGATPADVAAQFLTEIVPLNRELRRLVDEFVAVEQAAVDRFTSEATDAATLMSNLVVALVVMALFAAPLLAWTLSRAVTREITTAVQNVQSSSNELQTTANQQATSVREQAAAMTEIATTIRELVATARQIALGSQRVAAIAEETLRGAQGGEQAMQTSLDAGDDVKRQVDAIVAHMLELGRKSQQIGGMLDVINELAEQTNILSINAAIEAAGAGEFGRRFGVVADEIRKLSDRVGGSAKQIRSLVDDVRAAVHTTLMATETGAKTVDAATRRFGEVSAAFRKIALSVETTTEAAREIELSTKQQTTAVEQVNEAIAGVAQASREAEIGTVQTLQTIRELATLATNLNRFIQPPPRA